MRSGRPCGNGATCSRKRAGCTDVPVAMANENGATSRVDPGYDWSVAAICGAARSAAEDGPAGDRARRAARDPGAVVAGRVRREADDDRDRGEQRDHGLAGQHLEARPQRELRRHPSQRTAVGGAAAGLRHRGQHEGRQREREPGVVEAPGRQVHAGQRERVSRGLRRRPRGRLPRAPSAARRQRRGPRPARSAGRTRPATAGPGRAACRGRTSRSSGCRPAAVRTTARGSGTGNSPARTCAAVATFAGRCVITASW